MLRLTGEPADAVRHTAAVAENNFKTKDDMKDNDKSPKAEAVQPAAPETETKTKVCKCCGRELPLEAFSPHSRARDGHKAVCKECVKGAPHGPRGKKPLPKKGADGVTAPAGSGPDAERPIALSTFADAELVAELRFRGWEVRCSRMIKEEI